MSRRVGKRGREGDNPEEAEQEAQRRREARMILESEHSNMMADFFQMDEDDIPAERQWNLLAETHIDPDYLDPEYQRLKGEGGYNFRVDYDYTEHQNFSGWGRDEDWW